MKKSNIKTDLRLNKRYLVETPEGFRSFAGVGKICTKVQILKFILEDDTFIEVSTDHVFIVEGREEEAKYLLEGDVLETKTGLKVIKRIKLMKRKNVVYTL